MGSRANSIYADATRSQYRGIANTINDDLISLAHARARTCRYGRIRSATSAQRATEQKRTKGRNDEAEGTTPGVGALMTKKRVAAAAAARGSDDDRAKNFTMRSFEAIPEDERSRCIDRPRRFRTAARVPARERFADPRESHGRLRSTFCDSCCDGRR